MIVYVYHAVPTKSLSPDPDRIHTWSLSPSSAAGTLPTVPPSSPSRMKGST